MDLPQLSAEDLSALLENALLEIPTKPKQRSKREILIKLLSTPQNIELLQKLIKEKPINSIVAYLRTQNIEATAPLIRLVLDQNKKAKRK